MKLFFNVCLTLIAIAVVDCDIHRYCVDDGWCACGPDPTVENKCIHHSCYCIKDGQVIEKRQHQHTCADDTECADYDCTHHTGSTPFCDHHGPNEHGHSLCGCK